MRPRGAPRTDREGRAAPGIPFGYRPGNSPLHRCPAPLKLLALLVLSLSAYGSVPALAASALVISLGALTAGIGPWELLRGSRPLLFLAFLILLLRVIKGDPETFLRLDTAELPGALAQGLSMLASFASGALLFMVTTMGELRNSLGAKRRGPLPRFGLALSLMLGFLPRFFEIWEETSLALEARCGRKGIRRLLLMIPPVTERMIERALDTALALESRGLE